LVVLNSDNEFRLCARSWQPLAMPIYIGVICG